MNKKLEEILTGKYQFNIPKDCDWFIENMKEIITTLAIKELKLFHDHYDMITNELLCETDCSNNKIITHISLKKEIIDYLFPMEN